MASSWFTSRLKRIIQRLSLKVLGRLLDIILLFNDGAQCFFKPIDAVSKKIAVWILIPRLPLDIYNGIFLNRIGEALGSLLKFDKLASIHSRGQFARICDEIDLDKPLKSFISIRMRAYTSFVLIAANMVTRKTSVWKRLLSPDPSQNVHPCLLLKKVSMGLNLINLCKSPQRSTLTFQANMVLG